MNREETRENWEEIEQNCERYTSDERKVFLYADKNISGYDIIDLNAEKKVGRYSLHPALDWLMKRKSDDKHFYIDGQLRRDPAKVMRDVWWPRGLYVPIRNEGVKGFHQRLRGKAVGFEEFPEISFCCCYSNEEEIGKRIAFLARGSDIIKSKTRPVPQSGGGMTESYIVSQGSWAKMGIKEIFHIAKRLIESCVEDKRTSDEKIADMEKWLKEIE